MRAAYSFLISCILALLAFFGVRTYVEWPPPVEAPVAVVVELELKAPAPVVVEPGTVRRTTSGPSPGQWRSA